MGIHRIIQDMEKRGRLNQEDFPAVIEALKSYCEDNKQMYVCLACGHHHELGSVCTAPTPELLELFYLNTRIVEHTDIDIDAEPFRENLVSITAELERRREQRREAQI